MEGVRLRRIFAGTYRRYDGVYIHVVQVVEDVDTNDEIVIFCYARNDDNKNYVMSKQSFCKLVLVNGKERDKFKRIGNAPIYEDAYEDLENNGFKMSEYRKRKMSKIIKEYREEDIRVCRSEKSYESYAKDICEHFTEDIRRFNLTVKEKKYVGVLGAREFECLKEDITFLNNLLETVLLEYKGFFKARYIKKTSIRKYAAEKEINRGSVEYMQKKFLKKLATYLKERDEADNTSRLDQAI